MEKITVIIITKNEEKNISECLKSVSRCGELIVVDSGSTDDTVKIAKSYTEKVFYKKWEGYSAQKEYALSLASNEWVLSLDADERITEDLMMEISETVKSGNADGYFIRRDNYFLNKKITSCGWESDYQLRLFRKSKTSVTDRLVHEGFSVEGIQSKLKAAMKHYTFSEISAVMEKINTYSSLEAEQYKNEKKSGGFTIILHTISAFLRPYFSQRGYKDGVHGLLISLFNAISKLLMYAKIWEKSQK